jgi:hypothetical protein
MKRSLLLLLTACSTGPAAWGPGSRLDPGTDPRWAAQVATAAEVWDDALPDCGIVLEMGGPGDRPVLSATDPTWDATVMGRFDGRTVMVRPGLGDWELATLVHELGHALGFHHVSPSDDPDSVMLASGGTDWHPSAGDVHRGYDILGCR